MPGLNRFLYVTPGGLFRWDKSKVATRADLGGRYLPHCSDPALSAEDIALGYKQLLQVERDRRDMKTTLQLRPVYHRLEDRIRTDVILCWLALLLVRIIESTASSTWSPLREDLQELHLGTFEGPAGTFHRRTELTTAQRGILTQLDVDTPRRSSNSGRLPQHPDLHDITPGHTTVRAADGVPARQGPDPVSSANISCGTRVHARDDLPG